MTKHATTMLLILITGGKKLQILLVVMTLMKVPNNFIIMATIITDIIMEIMVGNPPTIVTTLYTIPKLNSVLVTII